MSDLSTEPESGFEIDGERYSIPTLDSLTLDEERVLYIYADAVVSDFIPVHPDWDDDEKRAHLLLQATKIRNPDFKRALIHVAYRRRHPDLEDGEINVKVGQAGALEIDLSIIRNAERMEDPPRGSRSEPDETNEKSTLERNGDSGSPTGTSSETPAGNLANTGISESATSSPESPPIESAS